MKQPQQSLPPGAVLQHGSCVAVNGAAVLIIGPSGSGKSALALDLMAFGARLVSDDQVVLTQDGTRVVAATAPRLADRIEARGVGILGARTCGPTPVQLVVDLAQEEPDRLPPYRKMMILGRPIDLVFGAGHGHLPAVILQYLAWGRAA